jgi:alpha-galactosidase
MFKFIDNSVPAVEPAFEIRSATRAKAGETVTFAASAADPKSPLLTCRWQFGDGSSQDGKEVRHAFTHPGEYQVQAIVTGLDAATSRKIFTVSVSGDVSTRFDQSAKQRAE